MSITIICLHKITIFCPIKANYFFYIKSLFPELQLKVI